MPQVVDIVAAVAGKVFSAPQEPSEKAAATDFSKTLERTASRAEAEESAADKPGISDTEPAKTKDGTENKLRKTSDEPETVIEEDKKTDNIGGDAAALRAVNELIAFVSKAVMQTAVPEKTENTVAETAEAPLAVQAAEASPVQLRSGMPVQQETAMPSENIAAEPENLPETPILPDADGFADVRDFISEVNAALEKVREAAEAAEAAQAAESTEGRISVRAAADYEKESAEPAEAVETPGYAAVPAETEDASEGAFSQSENGGQSDGEAKNTMKAPTPAREQVREASKTEKRENHFAIGEFKTDAPGTESFSAPSGVEELSRAVKTALERFTQDFRSVSAAENTVTIALTPEEFGSISITLVSENNAITAKIVTDNKEAASVISQQIQQFVESMAEKGVTVEKTEVVYSQTGQSGQGLGEGRHNADSYDGGNGGYYYFAADDSAEQTVSFVDLRDFYERAPQYAGTDELAAMEYKA